MRKYTTLLFICVMAFLVHNYISTFGNEFMFFKNVRLALIGYAVLYLIAILVDKERKET